MFAGKTAVITGAAGGMGRELALQLSAEGCNVAVCDVREKELQETLRLCAQVSKNNSAKAMGRVVNVVNDNMVRQFREDVEQEFGDTLQILINNAGITTNGPFLEMSAERFQRTFDVSWRGVLNFTRAFLPMVVRSKKGWVVNLSSINAIWCCTGFSRWPVQTPPHTPYSAAKAAIRGFTEALLFDSYQNFPHVTVTAVHPGHVGTDIARLAEKASGSDEEVVRMRNNLRSLIGEGVKQMSFEEMHNAFGEFFRDKAPLSARDAATQILDGMRAGSTRILVGEDAFVIDLCARVFPRLIYHDWFNAAVMLPWAVIASHVGRVQGVPVGRFVPPLLLALMGLGIRKVSRYFMARL